EGSAGSVAHHDAAEAAHGAKRLHGLARFLGPAAHGKVRGRWSRARVTLRGGSEGDRCVHGRRLRAASPLSIGGIPPSYWAQPSVRSGRPRRALIRVGRTLKAVTPAADD